jgi:hypothetical protein
MPVALLALHSFLDNLERKESAESDEVLGMLRGIDVANDSSRDHPQTSVIVLDYKMILNPPASIYIYCANRLT